MKESLQNLKCSVEFDTERKEIFARDLSDHYNEPACYNKTRRNLKKAWEAVKASWASDTTLHDVIDTLRQHGIRTHYWCMMD